MNRRAFLTATGGVAALLAMPQDENEAGFAALFDGKSLEGWSVQDGPEAAFYVNDGAIVVHESAGYPAWLRSARQYENFDFRGEFFVKARLNSRRMTPAGGRSTNTSSCDGSDDMATILAIHAHPDDVEILAGGTLALLSARGHRIAIATMTAGECGSHELGPEEISAVRRREVANAAALIGAHYLCIEMRDLAV